MSQAEPVYEHEMTIHCKISFDGKNLTVTASDTDEAKFIYAFKMFQALNIIEQNCKIKQHKMKFSKQERISITQARHITRKIMDQFWDKVLRGISAPKQEAIMTEEKL